MPEGEQMVVIVDDEDMIRNIFVRKTQSMGFTSYGVPPVGTDHDVALALMAHQPDIVVTDHDFGLGFTGVDVVRLLREWKFEGRIVVFSTLPDAVEKTLYAGLDIEYVQKPDWDGLRVLLRKAPATTEE